MNEKLRTYLKEVLFVPLFILCLSPLALVVGTFTLLFHGGHRLAGAGVLVFLLLVFPPYMNWLQKTLMRYLS